MLQWPKSLLQNHCSFCHPEKNYSSLAKLEQKAGQKGQTSE